MRESTIENFDDRDGFFGERLASVKQTLIFFAGSSGFNLNQGRDDSGVVCVEAAFSLAETSPSSCT